MEAWWKMRLYLREEKVPNGDISKDKKIPELYDDVHHDDDEEECHTTSSIWNIYEGILAQNPPSSTPKFTSLPTNKFIKKGSTYSHS